MVAATIIQVIARDGSKGNNSHPSFNIYIYIVFFCFTFPPSYSKNLTSSLWTIIKLSRRQSSNYKKKKSVTLIIHFWETNVINFDRFGMVEREFFKSKSDQFKINGKVKELKWLFNYIYISDLFLHKSGIRSIDS